MTASVIVPFNPDGAERSRNWEWVEARLRLFHPDLEVIVAGDSGERWCKARAVASGVEQASHDRIVMMDADVFVAPEALERALAEVDDDTWVIPHHDVVRLSPDATKRITGASHDAALPKLCCRNVQRRHQGVAGGGLVVLTRSAWERAPLDPRFEGWYGEDHSWGDALFTMVGPPVRHRADLVHLWHPEATDKTESRERNRTLRRRYRAALKRPHLMATIIEEIQCVPSPGA